MRVVFIGAGNLAVFTARRLLQRGFDVVMIEKNKEVIDELSKEMDTGFIHGDGGKPDILREADPSLTDILFCLSGNDQANIIASLVGRSLGFKRVVTRIEDPSYEHICIELGLADVVVPNHTMARYLADMSEGRNLLELSALVKAEARVFSFIARDEDAIKIADLALPEDSRVMFYYRNETFHIATRGDSLQAGDEVVLIASRRNLQQLEERWSPAKAAKG